MLKVATIAAALLVVSASTTVFADAGTPSAASDARQGSLGVGVLASSDSFLNLGVALEGTLPLGAAPVWLHALVATGKSGDAEGTGDFKQGRAGAELRSCTSRGGACLLVGGDVGLQRETWSKNMEDETHTGLIVGPRAGLDAGGEHLRLRASLELLAFHDGYLERWRSSPGATVALAYRF